MRKSIFPFYYGWLVLAAAAVSEILVIGATSYSAGLFVMPLQSEFHLSRADANSSILILFLGAALVAPFVGKILDRHSIRPVMCLGAVLLSLAFITIALTPHIWLMVLVLALPAAIGFMMLGPLTTATLVSRWFYKRRGLALGIAAIATSGGGVVVVPLLSQGIQEYGWRHALLYEALAMGFIIIGLSLLILRDGPFDVGVAGHSENQGRREEEIRPLRNAGKNDGRSSRWTSILSSRDFWGPSLALAAISGICQAIVITIVPYGVELGFATVSAAMLISVFSVAAALTKVSAGLIADYVDQRLLLLAASACMMFSLLLLCFFASYGVLLASCCLAGISLGCVLPTAAALIAGRFGSASFGAVMGWTYTLIGIFSILAVRFVGAVYDSTGGYHSAFTAFLVLSAGVSVATLAFEPNFLRK